MAHANFLCLTHNLMLLLEKHLDENQSMKDQVEPKKKAIRQRTRQKGWRKNLVPTFINSFFTRATQRTYRFIRWLRDCLPKKLPYSDSLAALADVWKCRTS